MVNRVLFPLFVVGALFLATAPPQRAIAQGPTQPLVDVTDIVVDSVEFVNGQLFADLTVTLDVVGRTVERELRIPLDLGGTAGAPGQCDILNLALGPIDLDLLGLVVELDDCEGGPITVDIVAVEGGGLLGDLLCGIAGDLLDGINLGDILGDLTDVELGMLTRAIEDVLNGVLDRVLMASGVAAQVSTASHQGGCDILMLDIPEGISLNLLGLQVDTSGICLDIHAERGPGNLLGNLLCSLTGLLNNRGNNVGGQLALVQNILRLLDRLGL